MYFMQTALRVSFFSSRDRDRRADVIAGLLRNNYMDEDSRKFVASSSSPARVNVVIVFHRISLFPPGPGDKKYLCI